MKTLIIIFLSLAFVVSLFAYFQLKQYTVELKEYQKQTVERFQEENLTKEIEARKDLQVQKALDNYYEENNGK